VLSYTKYIDFGKNRKISSWVETNLRKRSNLIRRPASFIALVVHLQIRGSNIKALSVPSFIILSNAYRV